MDKIGLVIPCFNNLDVLKITLPYVYDDKLFTVIFDDNSNDGTSLWLEKEYPEITILKGNGLNWWGGSLEKAIDYCLINECDYIVSLNADVCITSNTIKKLIETSKNNDSAIVASLVVDIDNPNLVAWAGSVFKKIHRYIPIFTSKYIMKAGKPAKDLGFEPYDVDEVHGRGVVIPSKVLKIIGNYDSKNFPHYGCDTDFSLRAKKFGFKMIINPRCISKVFINNTGLPHHNAKSTNKKMVSLYNYLTKRKFGEALTVQWRLSKKHLPVILIIPNYIFVILLNIFRKLS